MALRYIDIYASNVKLGGLLRNPHPLALKYLLFQLQSKKIERQTILQKFSEIFCNPNPEMIQLVNKLDLNPEEKRDIFLQLDKDFFTVTSRREGRELKADWLIPTFEEQLNNLLDCRFFFRCMFSNTIGSNNDYLTNRILLTDVSEALNDDVVVDTGFREMNHIGLVGILREMNRNPNDDVIDFLTQKVNGIHPNTGIYIHLPTFLENKNIRAFQFFRDYIYPNFEEYYQSNFGEGGAFEFILRSPGPRSIADMCKKELLKRVSDHEEIAAFVKEQYSKDYKRTKDSKGTQKSFRSFRSFLKKKPQDWDFLSSQPELFDIDSVKMFRTAIEPLKKNVQKKDLELQPSHYNAETKGVTYANLSNEHHVLTNRHLINDIASFLDPTPRSPSSSPSTKRKHRRSSSRSPSSSSTTKRKR
jgi:hypothetical protein